MEVNLIESLINSEQKRPATKQIIQLSGSFNDGILKLQPAALVVWRDVAKRYRQKEKLFAIPYALIETPKLYAIDALIIAGGLLKSKRQVRAVAAIFTVFYLMVHYFDDHVEHRDKFYSKFAFNTKSNSGTQKGAAPFSFVLTSFDIINDLLRGLPELTDQDKLKIFAAIDNKLVLQTRYFSAERELGLSVEDVLRIKQREVSGVTLSIMGDLLAPLIKINKIRQHKFEQGLIYLGSMTQITDDIRDRAMDTTLHNANIVNACAVDYGFDKACKKVAEIYSQELRLAQKSLRTFYDQEQLALILSLPFYPFFVDKQKLSSTKVKL